MGTSNETETGEQFRKLVRNGFTDNTAGRAPGFLQGNLVVLPSKDATDFLQFCLNNPKPCPIIGLGEPGDPTIPGLGRELDIRTDIPRYHIFEHGELKAEVTDISEHWRDDFVSFVLGCSFTFEDALTEAGLTVRHIERGTTVPMFKTGIPTVPGKAFSGPMVVSMRPYPASDVATIVDICARFPQAHGAPVHWGDAAAIGIEDVMSPDYGEPVEIKEGEIPVFWACGVTPQAALAQARPALCITHAPGHMLVTDVPARDAPNVDINMTAMCA